jgi:hypothetical protein
MHAKTVPMEAEFDRALDEYEAYLMPALCEQFGVSTPEQRSSAARKAVNAR